MKCLTSKANCLAYLTQHKHILTWQRGELGYSLQYAEPVTALHKNSGIYLANIPSLWKTLLWFPTSQHVSQSALAVRLTTTHKFKMCSLSKCRLFSRRVAQKWGKGKHEIQKYCDMQLHILQDDHGSSRPGFQRWSQGSGSVDSPFPLCPSPQEHSSALPEGEELWGYPWKERWGTGNQTCR